MRKTVSTIMLTLLVLSMLTIAINAPSVNAVTDPIISGTVRDKLGNPIPKVLIVAQDVSTELDVASATSNATGGYAMTVPLGTYNLIVTPPPESGFAPTTISNIEITQDTVIDIVLVPAETFIFSGQVVDRDGNPISNVYVSVYSAAISKSNYTDEQGLFSLRVPPDLYSLELSGWYYAPNLYESFWLYKSTSLNITEDTFISFTLQNRFLTGKVVDPIGNSVANVSIYVNGWTSFDDLYGSFEAWTTSDSQGDFSLTGFTSSSVSLKATPPPEIPYGPVSMSINLTEDTTVTVTLARTVTFSGLVVDRNSKPMANVYVSVYSAAVSKSTYTDESGSFSLNVPSDLYSLELSGWYYAPNLYESFWLYKSTSLNITEDVFMTFTLENRFLSGEVLDPVANSVANVSIYVNGWTSFDDLYGSFEAWTTSDSEGKFNVTVFTSPTVTLKATPPPENPYGPVSTTINVTEDAWVTITLAQTVTVTFDGLVVDRDGRPMPDVYVSVYSATMSKSAYTDEQGLFSMRVTPDSYSVELSGWYYAPNLYQSFWLYKATALNITQDTSITFTLQNRFLTGKVDCEGKPVANVSIYVNGWTSFDDLYGSFEAWTTSDSEGKFNVTVFTSPTVTLKATPPPESIYAPVSISNIDVTDDKMVLIALFYKAGVLPTASFTWNPETPEVDQSVTFDASTSIPGSGIIIRHKWSFGDGTYAVGKTVTHSYASPGVYTVTLNVTNSKGLWDIEQKQIQVIEPTPGPKPPVASFTYKPPNPRVNEAVTFDASGSYDPDGQIVSYNWNFGDGFTGEGKIATHSYLKEGNYKVTLTVIDDDGQSSSKSKTVTVLKPKMDERIDDAIAWALDWADGSPYPPGGPHADEMYIGWCLAFVQDAYQYGANAKIQRYEYAKQAADALGAENNKGIPPRGAFVFYNWYGTIDGEYRNWGHVGLSLGDGQMVHAWTTGPVVAAYDTIGLDYIGWAWPPLTPPIETSGLNILAKSPVDLVVIDPDYLVISKEYSEIPGAVYIEEDFNGDGSTDDYVFIPERKTGEYLITVIPEPDTEPTDTYTLEVSSEGLTFLLAENVPISDIPTEPYVLHSTTFEAPPVVTATMDIDPDTLNLNSKGKWITAYIELPEGYNVSDIDASTIMLNITISADLSAPIAIGDYDNDAVPDLMVCFNRTEVANYILSKNVVFGNITLEVSGKLYDGTEFIGTDTVLVSALLGDINVDGTVDLQDIYMAALAFGESPGRPKWNPQADINNDETIDLYDIYLIAKNFGKQA